MKIQKRAVPLGFSSNTVSSGTSGRLYFNSLVAKP